MSSSTELLAYAALALVAYAVALLLLWLWAMSFVRLDPDLGPRLKAIEGRPSRQAHRGGLEGGVEEGN